jgi:hypothetical protein
MAGAAAPPNVPLIDDIGQPFFAKQGGAAPQPDTRTIPNFSFSFTDPTNLVTYPLIMVGSSPSSGSATTVPTVIIPLKLNFANGVTRDGGSQVPAVESSPIFSSIIRRQLGFPTPASTATSSCVRSSIASTAPTTSYWVHGTCCRPSASTSRRISASESCRAHAHAARSSRHHLVLRATAEPARSVAHRLHNLADLPHRRRLPVYRRSRKLLRAWLPHGRPSDRQRAPWQRSHMRTNLNGP